MICKVRWNRALIAICAALSVTVLSSPATAGAAPGYPDLRTLPPDDIHLGTSLVGNENHYVVRFGNTVWNAGEGPFELHGMPHFPYDGLFTATQWIYDYSGGPITMPEVGMFAFHPSHNHFHFDGFARYELWRKRDYDTAAANGFTSGKPLYTSPKVSFCILDLTHIQPASGTPTVDGSPPREVYRTCSPAMEGISRGWGDIYDSTLPEQWVDVGRRPLPDGNYVIRSIADPDNLVYESPGKSDATRESQIVNSATSDVRIVNGRLPVPVGG
jgi:hypothetical protein